jgi:flagellar export protein FliJ
MSETRHPEDRALNAVRRVRDAREQDSRFGLRHALTAVRERDAEVERVALRRAGVTRFAQGTAADFTAHLAHLGALAALERRAVEDARDSRLVAEESTRRWQGDRQRVRVVDVLLERRAQERREERARRETRELDDLASQSWLRRRTAQPETDPSTGAGSSTGPDAPTRFPHRSQDQEVHRP